jgi:type IV secretory pathway VirB4 component
MVTNRHMIIKGGSGSGKSFNFGYFLNHLLPLGAKACIIDDLPSYADLCAAWGGHNLVMDYNQPICFNPFYGPLDADHSSFIQEIVAYMMSGGREDQRLDQEQAGVLAQAVGSFAARHAGGPELTLSDFYHRHLVDAPWSEDRRARAIARGLARRLGKFVGNGACAGFVDGVNTFALHPRLTVLQLSQIRDDDLKAVLVLALMHLLTVAYADPATWGIPKFFGVDESWALLDVPSIAALLLKVSLTYRKLGVSSCFISQHARHFSGPIGTVLKDIASIKLFLAHEASEIEETAQVFRWSAAEQSLFERGEVARHAGWSSAYLSFSDKKGGVVRIIPDAVTRWQLTQDDYERAVRAEAIAKADGQVWQAMAALTAQYPQGVAHA